VLFLVGALTIGCAGKPNSVVTTSPARLAWLRAEVVRAEPITDRVHGAYLPRSGPGAAIMCSLAVQIDAWYGVGDERWEMTNANASGMHEELARMGIRDCVLDMNR
jgi:hypothetical protein